MCTNKIKVYLYLVMRTKIYTLFWVYEWDRTLNEKLLVIAFFILSLWIVNIIKNKMFCLSLSTLTLVWCVKRTVHVDGASYTNLRRATHITSGVKHTFSSRVTASYIIFRLSVAVQAGSPLPVMRFLSPLQSNNNYPTKLYNDQAVKLR